MFAFISHSMYNVYMDKEQHPLMTLYTVEGFRKRMREALNKAEAGEPVLISRHNKVFLVQLKAEGQGK
jgi:hypothetical protein